VRPALSSPSTGEDGLAGRGRRREARCAGRCRLEAASTGPQAQGVVADSQGGEPSLEPNNRALPPCLQFENPFITAPRAIAQRMAGLVQSTGGTKGP
jgi:hypothetical protein